MKPDAALPGAPELLADGAREILEPAVCSAGGRLGVVRVGSVRYTPGVRMIVRYAAQVRWGDGSCRTETFGALLQHGDLPAGVAVVERDDGVRVGVWRYPHDPFLTGLPHAAYPEGARGILRELGLDARDVIVEPVVYRPGSRAVIRIRDGDRTMYCKVVRPGQALRLRDLHVAFGEHVEVPRCLGWSDELGVAALEGLAGTALTRPLVDGGALPPPGALLGLLRRVAHVELPAEPAPEPMTPTGPAALLTAAVPEAAGEIETLLGLAALPAVAALRTVHGDFYEAQVLVTTGRITGVLDLDSARMGGPLEDLANLMGHLLALAHVHPRAEGRISGYLRDLTTALPASTDPAVLHTRVLGVLLGLATTPFRRQEPDWAARTRGWLDLCGRWAADGA